MKQTNGGWVSPEVRWNLEIENLFKGDDFGLLGDRKFKLKYPYKIPEWNTKKLTAKKKGSTINADPKLSG